MNRPGSSFSFNALETLVVPYLVPPRNALDRGLYLDDDRECACQSKRASDLSIKEFCAPMARLAAGAFICDRDIAAGTRRYIPVVVFPASVSRRETIEDRTDLSRLCQDQTRIC
ncbi:uncharacterized protein N7511_007783 [Penicillium nucicola]|uniref:uncharacterized protein n=1 Tax=Penicillium nucicola TaxID=1850975 RepID=UPI002545B27A|nr:uncharacterized protein N7511_007783 [Penicillium nucicola]KAJ5753630.1 hypothetical protein N7511_007783 [Penicillium nucicola]